MNIYLLTDYKNHFGSRHFDNPYRSGFDKNLLSAQLKENGLNAIFMKFSEVKFRHHKFRDSWVLYTSSEDDGYRYKSYIEDIIYGLELNGAKLIPSFKYLRANNNKVFMEILRDQMSITNVKNISAQGFGTIEEYIEQAGNSVGQKVIKSSEGASGSGVYLAHTQGEIIRAVKQVSRSKNISSELWEIGRSWKHKGYIRDSRYRSKYIIQDFIPDLKNDWKVYIFGDRYFIFYRPIFKKRVFKASGGGYENYEYGSKAFIPSGIFDFAQSVFHELKVPHVSLDIGYDGKHFYLFEFQCLYFGTAGILFSDAYYTFEKETWIPIFKKIEPEKVYVDSIVYYIRNILQDAIVN